MAMTNKVFDLFSNDSTKLQYQLYTVGNIVDNYNKTLFKYTKPFKGRLSKPKTDTKKIPKQFMSIEEYINSNSVWRNIIKFINSTDNININDYIDTMIKNWHNIALYIGKPNIESPMANLIFSPKMVNMYNRFVNIEKNESDMNKHLDVKRGEDFYRLTPSMQSNINSLFMLKNLNSDLTFHDIINIFVGEFEQEFKNIILSMDENEISEDSLALKFR